MTQSVELAVELAIAINQPPPPAQCPIVAYSAYSFVISSPWRRADAQAIAIIALVNIESPPKLTTGHFIWLIF